MNVTVSGKQMRLSQALRVEWLGMSASFFMMVASNSRGSITSSVQSSALQSSSCLDAGDVKMFSLLLRSGLQSSSCLDAGDIKMFSCCCWCCAFIGLENWKGIPSKGGVSFDQQL